MAAHAALAEDYCWVCMSPLRFCGCAPEVTR